MSRTPDELIEVIRFFRKRLREVQADRIREAKRLIEMTQELVKQASQLQSDLDDSSSKADSKFEQIKQTAERASGDQVLAGARDELQRSDETKAFFRGQLEAILQILPMLDDCEEFCRTGRHEAAEQALRALGVID